MEHDTPVSTRLVPSSIGRVLLTACVLIGAASLVVVLVAAPEGSPVSADPGAPTIPTWVVVLPAVVGIVLTLLIPRRAPTLPAVVAERRSLAITTGAMIALAVAFPALVIAIPLQGETYVLGKLLLLIAAPTLLMLLIRRSVRIEAAPAAWRWWAPTIVVTVWVLLSEVAPWNPRYDPGNIDLTTLVTAAVATAVSASVGEELFYRRWLQTRLEATVGPWPGIALTALLFALMHLGSHGTGNIGLDLATVVVNQGSFGLFVGILWWRYRNLAMIILAHLIVNGWPVAAYVITAG